MRSSVLHLLIGLSGMVFGAEIVAAHLTQSLVLLISAYHMLYNILSLLLLVVSHRMTKAKTLKNTFGWVRVKVLGLLVNMLFLVALCFAAVVEAVQTMVHASHEDTEPRYPFLMVFLGFVNLFLNVLCFVLIGGYTHHQGCSMIIQGDDVQMNCVVSEPVGNALFTNNKLTSSSKPKWMLGGQWCGDHQILDVSRDVSSCLSVVACGSVVLLMDGLILKYADAILAVASVVVLLSTTFPFIKESGLILLQSIPNHIDVDGLRKRMIAEFPDILNVHDLHIWRLTTSEVIATVHVILASSSVYTGIEKGLSQFFHREGVSSATVQPEFTNGTWHSKEKIECILQCSLNNNCGAFTCCGPLEDKEKSVTSRIRNASNQGALGHPHTPEPSPEHQDEFVTSRFDFGGIASATETTL